ncbi:MAG: hypothetical protein AABZ43_04940 [Planctomycetota bacterium]
MNFIKWCLSFVTILGIPALSYAFEIHLTQQQIKEAIEYGAKYKGKEVFESPEVKKACFGEYPTGEGGIIMSKYVHTAVISAMLNAKDKVITPEDEKAIEESTTFDVVVKILDEDVKIPEDVQIILVQGSNNILPQKTEFGMKGKDSIQSIVGVFQQDKVNPKSNTTVIAKTRKGQKKYKVDFSDIK